MKSIRKGSIVKYIGKNELAQGKTFKVHKKSYGFIEILFPTKYIDGSIHGQRCEMPISDFEIVEER